MNDFFLLCRLSKLVSGPRGCVIDWLVVAVSSMDLCDCALAHLFSTLPENMMKTLQNPKGRSSWEFTENVMLALLQA